MAESKDILSVGIDIGTTTTQVVFSRLGMENIASYFAVPHVSIISKDVIYKSAIYLTPLRTPSLIDADAVKEIVEAEFTKAGFRPTDTQTGAVIITGESARKENAALVLEKLSGFAGDFVVSTAGPDLESIIAGKGSGAQQYSKEFDCTVANLDIGGGTTNIVVFDRGQVLAKGCLDIGGHLVQFSSGGELTYISPSAQVIAEWKGLQFALHAGIRQGDLEKLCEGMSQLIEQELGLSQRTSVLSRIKTAGSSDLDVSIPIHSICFSGGVADSVYEEDDDFKKYKDIGVLLGRAIRNSKLCSCFSVVRPNETIRATVVGAGTYTTTISGSTVAYAGELLPLKNIPVLKLTAREEADCFLERWTQCADRISWFKKQSASETVAMSINGKADPPYEELNALAKSFVNIPEEAFGLDEPLLVVIKSDMAKALGQILDNLFAGNRKLISLDAVQADDGDYLDLGKPLMNGLVVPVVIKTLIFG